MKNTYWQGVIAASPWGNVHRRENMEQTTNDDLNDHAVERAQRNDAERIAEECDALKAMLLEKNRAYGSSALSPVRIFAKSDTVEQIRVRIDDKLSRLMRGSAAGEDVVKDLLGYLILLRIATKEQWDKQVHVAASPEVIEEALAAEHDCDDPDCQRCHHIAPLKAAAAREDVGFALTDAEAAEAQRAVDAEWGGAVRRKLGIARGKLDGVADDLEEVGGWEETVKEIRQTLRETADMSDAPKPRPEGRGHLPIAYELDRAEAIAKRLVRQDRDLKKEIVSLRRSLEHERIASRAESDALREKLAFRVHEPGTFAALQAEVERLRSNSDSLHAAYDAAGISDLQNLAQHIKSMRAERDALLKEKQEVQGT